jgi:hypothetical protein
MCIFVRFITAPFILAWHSESKVFVFVKLEAFPFWMIDLNPEGCLCVLFEVLSFIMKPRTVTSKHKYMPIYKENYRSRN